VIAPEKQKKHKKTNQTGFFSEKTCFLTFY